MYKTWEAQWAAGEPFGCSTDIAGFSSYGFGVLDQYGFFEVPVPPTFAEAFAAENKARWEARREADQRAYVMMRNAFGGLFI